MSDSTCQPETVEAPTITATQIVDFVEWLLENNWIDTETLSLSITHDMSVRGVRGWHKRTQPEVAQEIVREWREER